MNKDEAPQDEIIRLQIENARLRAMIDRLERRSSDEPAPPAAAMQIIKAEPEPLPAIVRNSERPKKPRKKKGRKPATLSMLLIAFIALFALAVIIFISMELLFLLGIFAPWFPNLAAFAFILLLVAVFGFGASNAISKASEDWRRYQRQKQAQRKPIKPQNSRRRITRKLRAATTQKLDERDAD